VILGASRAQVSQVKTVPIPVVALLTIAALIGFAANSLLCRTALGDAAIDAASFTAIRIGSGAVVLAAIVFAQRGGLRAARLLGGGAGSWGSSACLFAYAAAFSFAYLRLTTATGALILFAAVQMTMLGWAVVRGERPRVLEWLGIAVAASGLVVLVLPGLAAPDPIGAGLMTSAGIAWGVYSLRGRGATRPLAATADNFVRAVPMVAVLLIAIPIAGGHVTPAGAMLAIASGAIASGLGYSLWYAALPHLAPSRAAIVQLSVPVIAAAGGALVLGESVSVRLAGATAAILGGIALALLAKRR
jgi:drug/metabolite transporter (DMT)-like permease